MKRYWVTVILLLTMGFLTPASGIDSIRVANRGVGGHNTRQGLSRLGRDVLVVKPQHLVIYFGMNDACNDHKLVPLDEFAANLQKMIDKSRKAGVKTIVLVTPNPVVDEYLQMRHKNHPSGGKFQKWLNKYDAAIRKTAKQNNLPLADLRKLCDQHGGAKITRQSLIRNKLNANSEDGVHLTQEGYRQMGKLIAEILKDKVRGGDLVVCFGDSITYGAGTEGRGTSYGQTYPAWLWLYLNRQIGTTNLEKPPVFKNTDKDNLAQNGDFEVSDDGTYAVFWRCYGAASGIESKNPHRGTNCMWVRNKYKKPCLFWYIPEIPIQKNKIYRYEFTVRGSGSIRLLIRQFRGGKLLGVFPPENKDAWIQATDKWKVYSGEFKPLTGTRRIMLMFQVKGNVGIDTVSLKVKNPDLK